MSGVAFMGSFDCWLHALSPSLLCGCSNHPSARAIQSNTIMTIIMRSIETLSLPLFERETDAMKFDSAREKRGVLLYKKEEGKKHSLFGSKHFQTEKPVVYLSGLYLSQSPLFFLF